MHSAARTFVSHVSHHATQGKAVEFGAYDVNGNVRHEFPDYSFYGIDLRAGANVDEVIDARDFNGAGSYDLVLSTEMLEHAPRPREIVDSAYRALKSGGLFVLTAAGPGRAPHCNNGGHIVPPDEHYGNIDPDDLRSWLEDWEIIELQYSPGDGDVYVAARKP